METVQNSTAYRIQLARDAAFSDLLMDRTGEQTHMQVVQSLAPGDHYWRIAAIDADGETGPFSKARHFTYRPPLAAPQSVTVKIDGRRPVFQWQAVPGADGYRLQVAGDPMFRTIVADLSVTETSRQLEPLASREYYYRVRASHPETGQGPYSAAGSFEIPPPKYWPLFLLAPLLLLL